MLWTRKVQCGDVAFGGAFNRYKLRVTARYRTGGEAQLLEVDLVDCPRLQGKDCERPQIMLNFANNIVKYYIILYDNTTGRSAIGCEFFVDHNRTVLQPDLFCDYDGCKFHHATREIWNKRVDESWFWISLELPNAKKPARDTC
jgi:hypothetical protein